MFKELKNLIHLATQRMFISKMFVEKGSVVQ